MTLRAESSGFTPCMSPRADLLEPALAARPGRVDLALEIPLPDAGSRRRLIELYGRGLALQMDQVETVIERTDGVTASFIKELMRKSALVAALDEPGEGTISLGDAQVIRALDELLDEENELTQVLLGRPRPGAPADAPAPGTGWMYRRLSPGE